MPRKLTTRVAAPVCDDGAIQAVVTLPVRPRRKEMARDEAPVPPPPRIPRITRLMALAIKFQDMVDRGEVRDYADLARLGYVTRARMTQIMNLLLLAPEIQEQIISTRAAEDGNTLTERMIRSVLGLTLWEDQRQFWKRRRQS